jgi:hypothetical protein
LEHCVEALGEGDHSGEQRYFFSTQTAWIAGPIEPLVVMSNRRNGLN